ncbi:hypothetical protein LN040_03820 [Desulfovibrio subterraneus]|uniref:bacteriophage T4 gp5 trimerisation domain-containing protein n=1 Tax=Desulfovibrio subterraneus TaxID=2718620 RepID=UPI0022B8602B|nr:hypothetical protein [Desulfovibrio subterraneus]WBF68241.1 hypothetical protein LN040_03820 [Desulfovibrio subterraneus]
MREAIRKIVLKLFPEIAAGLHLPRYARVLAVAETPEAGGTCERFRPRYAVDIQILTPEGEPDAAYPVYEAVPLPVPVGCGHEAGLFGYPRTGALVVVEFAYGRPDHPLIRNVYPLGLSLPQLQAGELRWMQSEAAHQGIDADGNWTRKTDMAITDASRDRIITAVRKMESVAREIRRVTENSTERVDGVKRVEALGALRLLTAGSARLSAGDSLSLTTARDTAITTGQDALQVVGRNVRTDVRGAVTTTVAKSVTETIGAGRTVTVTADDATTVGGNATESVAGDKAVTATNINLQCRNTLRLGAGEVSLLPLMLDVWEQVRQALEVLADHTHQNGAIPKPDQSGVVHGHAGAVGADRERLEGISG